MFCVLCCGMVWAYVCCNCMYFPFTHTIDEFRALSKWIIYIWMESGINRRKKEKLNQIKWHRNEQHKQWQIDFYFSFVATIRFSIFDLYFSFCFFLFEKKNWLIPCSICTLIHTILFLSSNTCQKSLKIKSEFFTISISNTRVRHHFYFCPFFHVLKWKNKRILFKQSQTYRNLKQKKLVQINTNKKMNFFLPKLIEMLCVLCVNVCVCASAQQKKVKFKSKFMILKFNWCIFVHLKKNNTKVKKIK